MTIIKNVCELIDTLTERLMQDAIDCCGYQIDLYLYVKEDGTAWIEDFVNVGGNSWLQDDHYCLHTLMQHYETLFDGYDDIGEIADALEMDEWELIHRAWCRLYEGDLEAPELSSIDFFDVRDYIKEDGDLMERLRSAAEDLIRGDIGDYREQAIDILGYFEDQHNEIVIEWPEGGA